MRESELKIGKNLLTDINTSFEKGQKMWTVGLLAPFNVASTIFEASTDRFKVFRRVKGCFFQMIEKSLKNVSQCFVLQRIPILAFVVDTNEYLFGRVSLSQVEVISRTKYIHCWSFMILANGHICERYELKTVIQYSVDCLVVSTWSLFSPGHRDTHLDSAPAASRALPEYHSNK